MPADSEARPPAAVATGVVRGADRSAIPTAVLNTIGFLSFFDRFATPPMLLVLADRTGLSLGEAVGLVASYSLFYALGQPVWGMVSDRFGRITVLRAALVGLTLAATASTLFSTYVPLLIARSAAGLMAGCLYPTLLTVLGDTRSTGVERARALSKLQVYSSLGTTVATLAAGTLAAFTDWRIIFGLPALASFTLLYFLRQAEDTGASRHGADVRRAFSRAALGVYAVTVLEGAVLMGMLAYIVPALQNAGVPIALAGVLAAGYGLGVIAASHGMRSLVDRFTRTQLMGIGGAILAAAYLISVITQNPVTLTASSVLMGIANGPLHLSVQAWATEVAPAARATTVALFACSLFLGSALGTFLTAGLANSREYGKIFGLGLAGALVLTGYHINACSVVPPKKPSLTHPCKSVARCPLPVANKTPMPVQDQYPTTRRAQGERS